MIFGIIIVKYWTKFIDSFVHLIVTLCVSSPQMKHVYHQNVTILQIALISALMQICDEQYILTLLRHPVANDTTRIIGCKCVLLSSSNNKVWDIYRVYYSYHLSLRIFVKRNILYLNISCTSNITSLQTLFTC